MAQCSAEGSRAGCRCWSGSSERRRRRMDKWERITASKEPTLLSPRSGCYAQCNVADKPVDETN